MQHLSDGEIVPIEYMPGWGDIFMREESQYCYEMWEWALKKTRVVGSNVKFDTEAKELVLDMSDQKHHVCNQMKMQDEKGISNNRKL